MYSSHTKRPRNVNAFQAAAILYGDWGTSKAYVIGLAFALAGYSSFWLILLVSILIVLVGLNYTVICKYYPSGGGVYASVRKRSEILSLVGAYFLIADYLVTAALSALSAFEYLGVPNPSHWAMGSVAVIGILNYLGPKHTGNLAFIVSIPTVIVVILLGLLSIPHLGMAIHNLDRLHGGFVVNWTHFVGIIVALSGIEAVANTTGVMKLDPGSDEYKPMVYRTSTPAIIWVMIEVSFFTALFALAVEALPGLNTNGVDVSAPNYPNVRDSMLRYMGDVFTTNLFGSQAGHIFGIIISVVFCTLLLSAVNTAILGLVSLLFVMSRDGEVPGNFQKLNTFGVPSIPLLLATIIPIILIFQVSDVAGLAELYAVGFVGAIATNLGSTSTDWKLNLTRSERYMMLGTFCIMAAIEITLLITKPNARNFAISILAAGLFLRGLVMERREEKWRGRKVPLRNYSVSDDDDKAPLHVGAMLCAVTHVGKTLEFAIQECKKHQQPLYLLYIREQKVITEEDRARHWLEDEEACNIFDYAKEHLKEVAIKFIYIVSDSTADSIVEIAKDLRISRIILGMPRTNKFFQLIRGNIVREVGKILPKEIDLLVIC